jgi:hypothetical protein
MSAWSSHRRVVASGLFVAATAAALASAGPDALAPFKDAAGAATQVSVAFVLDFGGSIGTVVGCVKVPSTDTGYEALTAFTQQQGEAQPTYASSGLLCSINSDPSSGCGTVVSGNYIYWSYWHGTSGTWQYSSVGASGTVVEGDVEGWRFQDPGTGRPNDPPPRAPSNYTSICGAVSSTPPPAISPPGPTTPSPGPSSSPSSSVVGPAGAGVANPSNPALGGVGASTTTTSSRPTTTTAPSRIGAGGIAPTISAPATTSPAVNRAQSLRASSVRARQGSGGSTAPLLIGGLVLVLLIGGSVFRWRKRPDAP